MADTFDVFLRLIMDEAAVNRIRKGASTVKKELQGIEKETNDITKAFEKQEKAVVSLMRKEAAALRTLASLRAKELADLKEKAAFLERGARPLFALGVSGFTAISLLAKKYIDSTEESNEITKAWAENSKKLEESQMRIGKIAAEAILPLFTKLAEIADKTADFAEKNPGIIKTGLNVSLIAAGVGALGILVAKGITLYADIKMIAVGDMQLLAAKIMSDAANKQLLAAKGSAGLGGVGTATATGTASTVGKTAGKVATTAGSLAIGETIVVLLLGTVAAALANFSVGMILEKTGVAKKIEEAQQRIREQGERTGRTPYQGVIVDPERERQKVEAFNQVFQALGITITTAASQTAIANETLTQNNALQAENVAVTSESIATNQGLMQSLFSVQRSSEVTSSALQRMPNAFMGVASGIVNFVNRIISGITKKTSGSLGAPVHDYTGYAYSRVYKMAQDGKRQFVMSGDMTRMAEQMLGGQLNQQAVLSAMANGSGRNVTINDYSRKQFSGTYTQAMRNEVRRDTRRSIAEAFKK